MAFGFAWVPSRKPFLKRRDMCFRYCIRPVPVVRLRLLLSDQLTVAGRTGAERGRRDRARLTKKPKAKTRIPT